MMILATALMLGTANLEKPDPGKPSVNALLQILNDPDCFKGNRMQQVKTHVEALQEKVNAQIEAEMAKARETVTTLKDRLCAMAEFRALNADQQEQLTRPFAEFNATIERQKHQPLDALKAVVVVVGDDPASAVYVRNKEKACDSAGFYHHTYRLPASTTEEEILMLLKDIENDCKIHGVIVQLPLPKHINEEKIINASPVDKDVDCFHPFNVGKLLTKKKGDAPLICAPRPDQS